MSTEYHFIATPFGTMRAEFGGDALRALAFAEPSSPGAPACRARHPLAAHLAEQLGQWFVGERTGFALPLAVVGTPFQRAVWAAVAGVPCGTVVTYAALAQRLGRPGAARAVGTALGRNPYLLIVPCHRVVATGGGLGGYAGGLERKRALLAREREHFERAAGLR